MMTPASAQALARELADLRRRLEAVERGAQMSRTSIEGGALVVNDAAGAQVLTVGRQTDGAYAVAALNGAQVIANTLDLPDGSITGTDIADNAISTPKLAANAVSADKIEAGAVTAAKLTADAIDGKTITGVTINAGTFRAVDPDGSYVNIYDEVDGDGAVIAMGLPESAGQTRRPATIRTGVSPRTGAAGIEIKGPDINGIGQPVMYMGGLAADWGREIDFDANYMWYSVDGCTWDINGGDWELAKRVVLPDGSVVFELDVQYWAHDGSFHTGKIVTGELLASDAARFADAVVIDGDVTIGGVGQGRGKVAHTVATTLSAAIGTTATVVDTVPNVVFRPGRAYRIEIGGGLTSSAAGALADMRLTLNSATGTAIGEAFRFRTEAGPVINGDATRYVRRTATTNLTANVCVVLAASTGTVTRYGSVAQPRWVAVYDVGPAADFPWAITIP